MSAWQAWLDLCASKDEYYSSMHALAQKQQRGEVPSLAERLYLEGLLKAHTGYTARFKDALSALAKQDPAAHARLVVCLGGSAAQHSTASS